MILAGRGLRGSVPPLFGRTKCDCPVGGVCKVKVVEKEHRELFSTLSIVIPSGVLIFSHTYPIPFVVQFTALAIIVVNGTAWTSRRVINRIEEECRRENKKREEE